MNGHRRFIAVAMSLLGLAVLAGCRDEAPPPSGVAQADTASVATEGAPPTTSDVERRLSQVWPAYAEAKPGDIGRSVGPLTVAVRPKPGSGLQAGTILVVLQQLPGDDSGRARELDAVTALVSAADPDATASDLATAADWWFKARHGRAPASLELPNGDQVQYDAEPGQRSLSVIMKS